MRRPFFLFLIAVIAVVAFSPVAARVSQTAVGAKVLQPLASAQLEKLLLAPVGWTKGLALSERGAVTADCWYTFTYVTYLNGVMKVRLTIADTGFDEGAIGALANMVMMFPDDHVGIIPPATTVK